MSGREKLLRALDAYVSMNPQEARDRELIQNCVQHDDDVFLRENLLYHMTASAWTVNPDRTKVLMAYHKIYNSWAWLGGHADGEEDLLCVAQREVCEESGVQRVRVVTPEIFSLEVLTVDGHEKHGIYVPSHLHLNVTYLIEADDRDPIFVKPDENSAVAWFTPEDALASSTEPWFQTRIYAKLIAKAARLQLTSER